MTFRVSFGRGDCASMRNPLVEALCKDVMATIERLRHLPAPQLRALSNEVSSTRIAGHDAVISVYRISKSASSTLIVVQGFVSSLRWPTFISTSRIGHMVAHGFVVDSGGDTAPASDADLWEYR